jgi:hypothetical protein
VGLHDLAPLGVPVLQTEGEETVLLGHAGTSYQDVIFVVVESAQSRSCVQLTQIKTMWRGLSHQIPDQIGFVPSDSSIRGSNPK